MKSTLKCLLILIFFNRAFPRCYLDRLSYVVICSNISSIIDDKSRCNDCNSWYMTALSINGTKIPTLPSYVLAGKFSYLQKLYLRHLGIKVILPEAFNGLNNLQELYLDNNELTELSNGVYSSLHKLTILNFANNNISQIKNYALVGLQNIKTLNLSTNAVETFQIEYLKQSSVVMNFLDLSSNKLKIVDFALIPNANQIILTNNQIVSIENLNLLKSTSVLRLSYNQLTDINDTSNCISAVYIDHNKFNILQTSFFQKSKRISKIDLSFNEISEIDGDAFIGLISLQDLRLHHNNISELTHDVFHALERLEFLDLSYNQITEFNFGTFDSLANLITLNISSNKLTELYQHTFNSNINLVNLYFDNNQITWFDAISLKKHHTSLKIVSLKNNPLKCEDLANIYQFFRSSGVTLKKGDTYDSDNFQGNACINQRKVVDAADDSVTISMLKKSEMNQLFNEDFENSKFVRYFEKDYNQSNFFKFFKEYKSVSVKEPQNIKAERTAFSDRNDYFEVASLVMQIIISLLLLILLVDLVVLDKVRKCRRLKLFSEVEMY